MTPLAGPIHAVALVLLLAGAAKAVRPSATIAALRIVGLPASPAAVRALAGVEVVVAGATLAGTGAAAAVALAAVHVGFAAVAVVLRRRSADCGCFGDASPVTATHVVVNLAAAAVVTAAVLDGDVPSIGAAMAATPGAGVPYAVLVGVLAAGEVLCLTALAEVQAAAAAVRQRAGAPS